MDRLQVDKKVKSIIEEQLGVRPEEVKDDAKILEDLGADSLDVVLEEEFSLEISDEDTEKITTVKEAVDYVAERIK